MAYPLFQALDRLSDQFVDPLVIRRWSGGSCNRLFRIEEAGRTLALRLNHGDTDRLGVDRRREATLLRALETASWTAPLLAVSDDWLLTAWVSGDPPAARDQTDLDWLAWALARVHAFPHTTTPLNMADQIRHLLDRGPPLPTPIEQALLRQCEDYRLPPRLCLCHHDWHPGNLIRRGSRWVLLDWEFAATGDPAMDVAAACRGFGLDDGQIRRLGRALRVPAARLDQALCLMDAVALVWFRANPEATEAPAPDPELWFRRWQGVRFGD